MAETWNLWISPEHRSYLLGKYDAQILKHNEAVAFEKVVEGNGEGFYADSGFDLFIPWNSAHEEGVWTIQGNTTLRIPLGVKVVRRICGKLQYDCKRRRAIPRSGPYYVYARSSISKIPLRLANNQGIIDSGYRGELMIALDNISDDEFTLKPGTRLVQACSPNLEPFKVIIVEENFEDTQRGMGGFGSTGR